MSERPYTVLVTDSNRGSAISIIRSLGRKGYRVVAGDFNESSLGFKSRYAGERLVYPDPKVEAHEFADAVLEAVRTRQIDLIIPVTDNTILPLSGARERFAGLCQIAMAAPDQLEIVTDKLKTIDLAQRTGVPVPRTQWVETVAQAARLAPDLEYPVVLKPQRSRQHQGEDSIDSFAVTYANGPQELIAHMKDFEGRSLILLQEYYQGDGYGVELLAYQGQPLAAFQHKRLHEVPLTGGTSSYRESVPLDATMYEYSRCLLRELNWTGLAMVEFKVGADGPKLMEINGRVWGSLPLAVHSGMDFPARLVELYRQESLAVPAEPDTNYRVGVRSHHLQKEVSWIIAVLLQNQRRPYLKSPGRMQALWGVLGLFDPRAKFDIQSFRDPGPSLAEIPQIVRKMLHKLEAD